MHKVECLLQNIIYQKEKKVTILRESQMQSPYLFMFSGKMLRIIYGNSQTDRQIETDEPQITTL